MRLRPLAPHRRYDNRGSPSWRTLRPRLARFPCAGSLQELFRFAARFDSSPRIDLKIKRTLDKAGRRRNENLHETNFQAERTNIALATPSSFSTSVGVR